jgi:hypothetical protein
MNGEIPRRVITNQKLAAALDKLEESVLKRDEDVANGVIPQRSMSSSTQVADEIWEEAKTLAGTQGEGHIALTIYDIARHMPGAINNPEIQDKLKEIYDRERRNSK